MSILKKKRFFLEREKRTSFYIFIGFWLVGFLFFQLIPIVWGFRVSLTNRMAFTLKEKFIGFANYANIFADPKVMQSFYMTVLYTVSATAVVVTMGLFAALMVERNILGRGVFRTLVYIPYVIPVIAVGWIFRIFLERDVGLLNVLLLRLNLIADGIKWLNDYPFLSILSLSFWRCGWSMMIFLGGLSTVPEELYEVATIDGAGFLRKLRNIILPMISPFILFQIVVSFIYAMQVFLQPFILNPRPILPELLTETPPPSETFFLTSRAYYTIFSQNRFAYGVSMLWLLFGFVIVVTIILFRLGAFWVYTQTEEKQ